MPNHLLREIDNLKKMILSLAALVEENLRQAVRAVAERDGAKALKVIDQDHEIDRTEVGVEEECLKVLALHQPVAHDLRFIVAILKINHDLERMGDLAVSIAERARDLSKLPRAPGKDFDLPAMAEQAQQKVARALDALINNNLILARQVWLSDDEIDQRNRDIFSEIEREIQQHPDRVQSLLCMMSVSRNLERIADHASSIAKDVIYMVEGEIVRHRSREYRAAHGV